MINKIFTVILEHYKITCVVCIVFANAALFTMGIFKSFNFLWYLSFLIFTVFSALCFSLILMTWAEKKIIYKILFQIIFYTLAVCLALILDAEQPIIDQLFAKSRFTLFVLVFMTILLMINLSVAFGYSIQCMKLMWNKFK